MTAQKEKAKNFPTPYGLCSDPVVLYREHYLTHLKKQETTVSKRVIRDQELPSPQVHEGDDGQVLEIVFGRPARRTQVL
jgi:hypothetical protein